MIPIPKMTFTSIIDYMATAAGIAIGFAIFNAPMNTLEKAFRRK